MAVDILEELSLLALSLLTLCKPVPGLEG